LADFWSSEGLSEAERFPFELALEEVFMNIVMHGSQGLTGVRAVVALEHVDQAFTLTVSDTGNPFDPLAAPPPDTDAAMEDRPIGGLGIYLIRTMMDAVEYRHEDGHNVLVMHKRIGAEAA
jgi:anti-sigma regulatory factor (Ser/Thr protein kinase)